jgi:hypothetical protein
MALVAVMRKAVMDNNDKFGQKRDPKDVKIQPQDEFITQTSNDLSQAASETPVHPGAAVPDDQDAQEIDEEGLELKKQSDKIAGKDDHVAKVGQ